MVFDVVSPQPGGMKLAALNPAAERMTGVDPRAVGLPLAETFSRTEDERLVELVCDVARSGAPGELGAHRFAGVLPGVFRIKAFCLDGTEVGLAIEDVTAEVRARELWQAEQKIFELVASGAKLEDSLTELVLRVEELAPPAIASVLLLTADGKRLVHGAAPHLPIEYNRAIDGADIGPVGGSCGTAAALKRTVIVTDTQLDPLWAPYRELASRYNLRACWSTPIEATGGRVLGTFALYYREPRAPSHDELEIIARAVHVAGIAIQRHELDEQLRALSARLEAAREEERTSIAREIHDHLGQTLTVLKLDLSWISRRASGPDGIAAGVLLEKVKDLSRSIDALINDVRRISAELRPGLLDDIGLVAALSWKAQQIEERTSIACSVDAAVDNEALTREVATAVYRIVEEALTNVVRHSGATLADIHVEQGDGSVLLEVRDNGKGILDDQIDDPQSFGLVGIRERARRLGGSASFGRTPGGGTQVTVKLPLR
jgi:signal transduction histidine kinase